MKPLRRGLPVGAVRQLWCGALGSRSRGKGEEGNRRSSGFFAGLPCGCVPINETEGVVTEVGVDWLGEEAWLKFWLVCGGESVSKATYWRVVVRRAIENVGSIEIR